MHVLGIPQLYGYVIGWWQYDLMWQVIRDTGLFYIPFPIIFGRAVIVPFMSQETRSAATTAIKRLAVSMVSVIVIIMMFYSPAVTLGIDSVKFVEDGNSYVVGKTGTTYDHHLNLKDIGGGVYIPIGWVLALNTFNGIAGVGFNSLSDSKVSARKVMQDLSYATIKDPVLKAEVTHFMNACYTPSYASYINHNYPDSEDSAIQAQVKKYGQADLGWIGSYVLTDHFYQNYQALTPVIGFPFDPKRDVVEGQVSNHSKWGRPMCNEWWSNSTNGLETQLQTSLNKQIVNEGKPYNLNTWVSDRYNPFWGAPYEELSRAAIQVFLQKSLQKSPNGIAQGYYSENDMRSGFGANVGTALSKVGVVVDYNTTFSGYITTLINMLPVIQAMMLCILFALIPFGAILSCFGWKFLITALSMAFALIMMTYVWHLASYLDNLLITSLYQSPDSGYSGIVGTLWNYGSSTLKPAQILVDITVSLMYLGFPMFMFGLIGWAGVNIGDAAFRSASSGAESRAGSVSNKGLSVATKGILK